MNETSEKINLVDFLITTKGFLKKCHGMSDENIHFIIGNESADLDSIVSAIVYAFFLKITSKDIVTQFVPIIPIQEDELELRSEVIVLLKLLSIPSDSIIFANDVNFSNFKYKKVTLVDHNNIGKHAELKDAICEVIDHHEDSMEFIDIPKNIKMVGSCSTLITEKLHYHKDINVLDIPSIADLLLSAVLIDTFNLDLHSGRTTELDIFLGEILCSHTDKDPDQLFSLLQEAKLDISSMSSYNILRKDYKNVPHSSSPAIGISSATIDSAQLLSRNQFMETAKNYMEKLNLQVLILMFLSFESNSKPFREISVICFDENILNDTCNYLLSFEEELELTEQSVSVLSLNDNIRLFDQSNVNSSRKVVLPIMQRMNINS